jgi:peroxiredoxin Q/BCP
LLSDVDRVVGEAYGAKRDASEERSEYAKRLSFLIDPDGKIARAYEVTDVAQHPSDVLADLRSLRA